MTEGRREQTECHNDLSPEETFSCPQDPNCWSRKEVIKTNQQTTQIQLHQEAHSWRLRMDVAPQNRKE